MATATTNERKLSVKFFGTEAINHLCPLNLADELLFPPIPQHRPGMILDTSPPVDGANAPMNGTTFPSLYEESKEFAYSLKCRAKFSEDSPEFFIKLVLHVERGLGSMEHEAAKVLALEAVFYAEHLEKFQGDIVPRHYGMFRGKTTWGGTIVCAVLDYFHGFQWSRVMRTPMDTLENQRLVAEAAAKLHDAGINHTQIGDDDEHHILFDDITNSVKIVGFTAAAVGHSCSAFEDEPRQSAITEKVCADLESTFLILPLWYRERTLKFKLKKEAENDTSKQSDIEVA